MSARTSPPPDRVYPLVYNEISHALAAAGLHVTRPIRERLTRQIIIVARMAVLHDAACQAETRPGGNEVARWLRTLADHAAGKSERVRNGCA